MLRTPRTFHTTYTHGVEVYATGRFQHPVYRYAADDSPLPADVNETLRRHCGDRASEVLVLCDVKPPTCPPTRSSRSTTHGTRLSNTRPTRRSRAVTCASTDAAQRHRARTAKKGLLASARPRASYDFFCKTSKKRWRFSCY